MLNVHDRQPLYCLIGMFIAETIHNAPHTNLISFQQRISAAFIIVYLICRSVLCFYASTLQFGCSMAGRINTDDTTALLFAIVTG